MKESSLSWRYPVLSQVLSNTSAPTSILMEGRNQMCKRFALLRIGWPGDWPTNSVELAVLQQAASAWAEERDARTLSSSARLALLGHGGERQQLPGVDDVFSLCFLSPHGLDYETKLITHPRAYFHFATHTVQSIVLRTASHMPLLLLSCAGIPCPSGVSVSFSSSLSSSRMYISDTQCGFQSGAGAMYGKHRSKHQISLHCCFFLKNQGTLT